MAYDPLLKALAEAHQDGVRCVFLPTAETDRVLQTVMDATRAFSPPIAYIYWYVGGPLQFPMPSGAGKPGQPANVYPYSPHAREFVQQTIIDSPPNTVADAWRRLNAIPQWASKETPLWIVVDGMDALWTRSEYYVLGELRLMLSRVRGLQYPIMLIFPTQKLEDIPRDIRNAGEVVSMPLPDVKYLTEMTDRLVTANQRLLKGAVDPADVARAADILKGLSVTEARRGVLRTLRTKGGLDAIALNAYKAQTVRTGGILELVATPGSLDDVGGLVGLKQWVSHRLAAFNPQAARFGLPLPKGVLVVGPPGTGKSLIAKTMAASWGFPLLRFDFAAIYGKYMGESESRLQETLRQAEAASPVVLWMDEIEKAMALSEGGSATPQRAFGLFLTWLNEKTSPVFIVATANDVRGIPPEFLRKGRFDELFYVDFPSADERKAIWEIHLRKRHRDPAQFPVDRWVDLGAKLTGAEIEQTIVDALFRAFNAGRELTAEDVEVALHRMHPIAETMATQLESLQEWAKWHALRANDALE